MESFHFLRPAWLLVLPAALLLAWIVARREATLDPARRGALGDTRSRLAHPALAGKDSRLPHDQKASTPRIGGRLLRAPAGGMPRERPGLELFRAGSLGAAHRPGIDRGLCAGARRRGAAKEGHRAGATSLCVRHERRPVDRCCPGERPRSGAPLVLSAAPQAPAVALCVEPDRRHGQRLTVARARARSRCSLPRTSAHPCHCRQAGRALMWAIAPLNPKGQRCT